jgi:hypothetical protein
VRRGNQGIDRRRLLPVPGGSTPSPVSELRLTKPYVCAATTRDATDTCRKTLRPRRDHARGFSLPLQCIHPLDSCSCTQAVICSLFVNIFSFNLCLAHHYWLHFLVATCSFLDCPLKLSPRRLVPHIAPDFILNFFFSQSPQRRLDLPRTVPIILMRLTTPCIFGLQKQGRGHAT